MLPNQSNDNQPAQNVDKVTLFIDGKEISVPKGTNLIDAAKAAGVDVPHYCYHPHLSVAGNCRMCQVQVEGAPKLTIACNTQVTPGMKVLTQKTSAEVEDAQRATLEFLLINHPLDCTVCDAAGHCKLQDYYYEYNSKSSRFLEEKEKKVKALPLGPEVIYDGERCIVCTRCVRFCDEVTKTSELGVFNRGNKSVIGINPDKPLTNPLSGSVVDLCPVGALTHRQWRFNTRIWYTTQVDGICVGCSTGCNTKVATRDGEVVYVKARENTNVNQEWMCDEGRYGYARFSPKNRLKESLQKVSQAGVTDYKKLATKQNISEVLNNFALAANKAPHKTAILLSPFLTFEETWLSLELYKKLQTLNNQGENQSTGDFANIAMQVQRRNLSETEAILISPDYSPNIASYYYLLRSFGLDQKYDENWRKFCEDNFSTVLSKIENNEIENLLVLGEAGLCSHNFKLEQFSPEFLQALEKIPNSVACVESEQSLAFKLQYYIPTRSVYEKSGVFINKDFRVQFNEALFVPEFGVAMLSEYLQTIAKNLGVSLFTNSKVGSALIIDDRNLFNIVTENFQSFKEFSIKQIKNGGILAPSW